MILHSDIINNEGQFNSKYSIFIKVIIIGNLGKKNPCKEFLVPDSLYNRQMKSPVEAVFQRGKSTCKSM